MKRTFERTRHLHTKTPVPFGVFLVCAALLLVWVGSRVVIGKEDEHIFILPTEIAGQGWESIDAVREQSLSEHAGFDDFNTENSALVSIGEIVREKGTSVDESAPEEEEALDVPDVSDVPDTNEVPSEPILEEEHPETEGTVTEEEEVVSPESVGDEAGETVDEQPAEAVETVEDVQEAETGEGDAPVDEPQASAGVDIFAFVSDFAHHAIDRAVAMFKDEALAQETVEESAVEEEVVEEITDEAAIIPVEEEVVEDVGEVPEYTAVTNETVPYLCEVKGLSCHTLEFSGFDVTSVEDEEVKNVSVKLSLGSISDTDGVQNDRLVIRYLYRGEWRVAGEVVSEYEISNLYHGGYFTFELPEVRGWEDLSDLAVSIEYDRNEDVPTRLFIDAVWLDVAYSGDEDNLLTGDNLKEELHADDVDERPDHLTVSDVAEIGFSYTDEYENESLLIKTDRPSYTATSDRTAYFNVTNLGGETENVSVRFYAPKKASTPTVSLQKWSYDVPYEVQTPKFGDTAYFCEYTWLPATSSDQFVCGAEGEVRECDDLNEDGTNCISYGQEVGTDVTTSYRNQFTEMPILVSDLVSDGVAEEKGKIISSAYDMRFTADGLGEIAPGETLYFAITVDPQEAGDLSFYLEAMGSEGGYGLVGPKRSHESIVGRLPYRDDADRMNAEVLYGKDHLMSGDLSFTLRYRSQKGFLRRLFSRNDELDFNVRKLTVTHVSGKSFEIAPEEIVYGADGEWSFSMNDRRSLFIPGKYSFTIEIEENGDIYTEQKEVFVGVLALNVDKSIYTSGERADISMAALSDTGSTVCDADLELIISDPIGITTKVPVISSGLCDGNNVVDVPDYAASYLTSLPGVYTMELVRFDTDGRVMHDVIDTFEVRDDAAFSVQRTGPTRIYPVAPYVMKMTISSKENFSGEIVETLPAGFTITDGSGAAISEDASHTTLVWNVDLSAGQETMIEYTFDAPDRSPYLYLIEPLRTMQNSEVSFEEVRDWQIASDATGNMLIFWEGSGVPSGWTCVSCASGDPFYQQFIVGSSTYGATGGASTHTHTASQSLYTSSSGSTEDKAGTGVSVTSHSHTFTATIGSGSLLPSYRQLKVLRYDSAGEPTSLPTGAIVVFDGTVPSGWTRLSAQDGYYVRGENTAGTTGGSNTHTHTITGTTGAATGGDVAPRGGGTATGALSSHTHTISSSTGSVSNEPPYIEVILASLDATSTPPNGIIGMWTDTPANGWVTVSDTGGDLSGRLIKGASSYGTTGGTSTHTHVNVTGIASAQTGSTGTGYRTGTAGASGAHTHTVDVTGFATMSNLPPYITAIFAKREGADTPIFTQNYFRWYANEAVQTPTDPWPSGATELLENENITATSTAVKPGDVVRLRMSVGVTNATTTATTTPFKLQFGERSTTCAAIGEASWTDVGKLASSTIWKGYDNSGLIDGSTLSSTTLSVTDVAESYEEENVSTTTPNIIYPGQDAEWDWVIYNDSATGTANYCFRMVEEDGTPFNSYTRYPTVETNHSPDMPTLSEPFDNEKVASTSPWFEFVAVDDEGEKVHYQIQIDDDPAFGSPTIDNDTIDESDRFENLVAPADKPAFVNNNTIRFTPSSGLSDTVTYWWRVRAKDPDGSDMWGEWSSEQSFTVDQNVTISTWFQTTQEQFETDTLSGTEALTTDAVDLISGSSTGSLYGSAIDFDWKTTGTIWGELLFSDTEGTGDIKYHVEYYTSTSSWALVPDTYLSGNTTGFDTTQVSLEGLDTSLHNVIRIRADFDRLGAGDPSLQDWTVAWGTRVETPTLDSLFDNEKTATTTPSFEFTTTDPQGEELRYEISWSTSYDFTSSTTRVSGTDTGFVDLTSGDLDPFASGDVIRFTIQPADALTVGTTYWWRVRAKDPDGGDSWSLWSEARSFTVDTSVTVSTWFQTTSEQFETDVLSGLTTTGGGQVTVATTTGNAMIVYAEGTVQTPRYRSWSGASSSWGPELSALSVGAQVNWVVLKAGITRDEYALGTLGTDADVNVQIYSDGEWGDLQEVTAAINNVGSRGFDMTYETTSGDLMVATCDGDADPSYYIWNGSSWVGPNTVNLSSANNCDWIKLASDPTSDEIVLLSRDSTGSQYEAQVWDGSSWGSATTLGSMTESAHEGMSVMYEESGGQAVVIASNGNAPNFTYNTWNGSTWGTAATQSLGNDLEWGTLKRDVGTDAIVLCYVDENSDIGSIRWTGSAWTGQMEFESVDKTNDDRPVDCEYEVTTGRDGYVMAAYSDDTNARYQYFNGTAWSTEASVSSITDSATIQLRRTGTGSILGVFFDDTNGQYDFSYWNGTAWSTAETLEDTPSVTISPYHEPFMIAPQNPQLSGTLISSEVDFNDGLGPYWDELNWTDTHTGGSDILFQVQYYNTASSSWDLVPDTYLPGNSTGTTTGPIDLGALDIDIHDIIRTKATFTCNSGTCPLLSDMTVRWAEGITVSGTAQGYDQSTNVTSGTVEVAVNGVVQTGKTGTISGGTWNIPNVTVFSGDVLTIFISGAADANEAVAVTKYDGNGDVTNVRLYERHLSLGSDDNGTITNADLALYDNSSSGNEDVFHDVVDATNDLDACDPALTGCEDVEIYVRSNNTYRPDSTGSGNVATHDIEIDGEFIADSNTVRVSGSWDNDSEFDSGASTVIFTATSGTESVDSTGAATAGFYHVTFGETSGSAGWSLVTDISVSGNTTVSYGSISQGSSDLSLYGDLSIQSGGAFSKGTGTTTFMGSVTKTWSDATVSKQDLGTVVIDGSYKTIQLGSGVKATDLVIGADDAFDVTSSSHPIEITGSWTNNNSFVARSGIVSFTSTSTGRTITAGGSSFYSMTFNGAGGGWTFQDVSATIGNDLTISAGSLALPTGTTTIGGSLSNSGTFTHAIGAVLFNSTVASETVAPGSSSFYNLLFNGTGSWTIAANATSTNDLRIQAGTVTLSSDTLAVGGSFTRTGGSFIHNSGNVYLTSTLLGETIQAGASSFYDLTFDGAGGDWTFQDTSATIGNDMTITAGSVTLPTATTTVSGSFRNYDSFVHSIGTILFNSSSSGRTVSPGSSTLYSVVFNNASGGWTVSGSATSTNDWRLVNVGGFVAPSGGTIEVQGEFQHAADGNNTTWDGSTLFLNSGTAYAVNTKTAIEDTYNILRIGADTDISIWNSSAATTDVAASGSLYSQDHAAIYGDLYIWGDYVRTSGTEYWSYATDFDGADLSGGNERQVDVRLASNATTTISGAAVLEVRGTSTDATSISSQSGTYSLILASSTIDAEYYSFRFLDMNGLQLLGSTTVTSLDNGSFDLAALSDGGTMMTVSSTTIDHNPLLQIYDVAFATSSGVTAGYNVTQTGGEPSSYWWFRDHTGNYDGESYDLDTGNPGSIRWDDSNLTISVSGVVYAADEVTPLSSATCDGVTPVVRLKVNGLGSYAASCSATSSYYSIPDISYNGDVILTVYLDGAAGGERASLVTRTPTGDVANADLYDDHVVVSHEDTSPLSIANMTGYDSSDDADIAFTASTGSPNTLVVEAGIELFVRSGKTFRPGGNVTLLSGGNGTAVDGTMHVDDGGAFVAAGTESHTVGGSWTIDTGAWFTAASSTVTFTSTTTSKTIQPNGSAFFAVVMNGSGGEWSIDGDMTVRDDLTLTAGEVIGTHSITVQGGDLVGDGSFAMTGGIVTLSGGGSFGGGTDWSFASLSFGDGVRTASTTKTGTNDISVSGTLTVVTAHALGLGGDTWTLSGSGTPLVIGGTFSAATSTVRYTGTSSTNVTATGYYDLVLAATAGSPTYTLSAGAFSIGNDLTIGDGANTVSVTANTNDPSVDVNGDVIIRQSATYTGSNSGVFTVGGSWTNAGTFTHGSGTVTFDSTDTGETIQAGISPFNNITLNSVSGGWTVVGNASSTANWNLANAASFTASSSAVIQVGGVFTNGVGGASTTWSGATLYLFGTNQTINTKTTGADTYDTLRIGANTDVRMWNSTSTTYTVDPTGSLYSQDHNGSDGSLYIWGDYTRTSGADYWSYATDFDGTDLAGVGERIVDVRFAPNATSTITGGSLYINGAADATTTVQTQGGTGTYALVINGGNINANRYRLRNIDASGLRILGSSAVSDLSYGDLELAVNDGSMMTVAATAITANPLKTFSHMSFAAAGGVTSGYNIYVSGTTVSSWRITTHSGGYDGEDYDYDLGGDPGYVVWDDSAADIIVSGYVYSNESGTVSGVCDGSTPVVRLMVSGGGDRTSSCNASTGAYSVSGIIYTPGDVITVYLDEAAGGEQAANVTVDPFTNVSMDLYEDRVIVRHEDVNPISIADMAIYDSDQDGDIPFDADTGSPNTLVLVAGAKLIIWDGKTFVPGGNVTLNADGSGNGWDGTLAIRDGATFSAAGTQTHTIGGSWIASSTASFVPGGSTVIFTATTGGKTVLASGSSFNNVTFNGSGGSWIMQDTNATTTSDMTISAGSVTLPSGTLAVGGSFNNSGGSFTHQSGILRLFATTTGKTLRGNGSSFGTILFGGTGGGWTMQDTNATSTSDVAIVAGSVTLPSGVLAVGGSFDNSGGSFTHGGGTLRLFATTTGETITAGGSSFKTLVFDGVGGGWDFQDVNATTTGDMVVHNGAVLLPTGVTSIFGSFTSDSEFTHAIGTLRFVATTTSHTVEVGTSTVFNMTFEGSGGGWTVSDSATSTNDWEILAGSSYVVSSGNTIEVQGDFINLLGGSATTWDGSTLKILSENAYGVNTKTQGGDRYDTLIVGGNSDLSMWNSSATSTTVASSSSLYSQDHAAANGDLYIWGDYVRTEGADYWSYAKDFDGTSLVGGNERQVDVRFAENATSTFSDGTLEIIGTASLPTTINNQGSGSYGVVVSGGTLNARYYQFRNMNAGGLQLLGSPTVTALDNGDFQLAVDGGTMMTVSSSTIDQNPSKTISGMVFSTDVGVSSGYNVARVGTSTNAWTFVAHSGNYDGESYDLDGGDGCGQLRWSDSSCLFVNQAHYRWRNDDGGEGVPAAEWFDTDWQKRKDIQITDASGVDLTDQQVKLVIPYDADMQSNFGDLRFTDESGTTSIAYWIESYSASGTSTIWVTVPSIPADGSVDIYMYYDNVGTINTSGSGTSTFVYFDDFEDDDIDEYSGDTSLFDTLASFAYQGSYGLGASSGNQNQKTTDGIYRTGSGSTVSQGETIRFFQYVDLVSGSNDEPCALFGVQSPGSDNDNYAVCLDPYNQDTVTIAKDVSADNDSGTILATKNVTFSTGWYEVEVDWLTTDDINVTVYSSSGSVFATTTVSDSSYTSGGVGFSFWSQYGGWDYMTSRAYTASDPEYIIGLEQTEGGASWKEEEDTPLSNQVILENLRLRFSIQNTGLDIVDQNFRLQYANRSGYANCLAVPYDNYVDVPTETSGCGSAAACMTTSSEFTNKTATTRLLTAPTGLTYVAGQIMEDPSNETDDLDVPQDSFTEVEYSFEMTVNATGSTYCFRSSDGGDDLDNYSQMAEVTMLHAPSIMSLTMNNDENISLIESSTTTVHATGTVIDLNGYEDIAFATSTFYRSGIGAGCVADPNNCYRMGSSSCSFSNCSGTACDFYCSIDFYYFADPTDDDSPYFGQDWLPEVTVYDSGGNSDTSSGLGVLAYTLQALSVLDTIDYGVLSVGSTTESYNATTTLQNTGNGEIDVSLDGSDLMAGSNSLDVTNQKYATSTFVYSSCLICNFLTGTSTNYEVDLPKQTATSSPVYDDLYWGIQIPDNTAGSTFYGTNMFTPIPD